MSEQNQQEDTLQDVKDIRRLMERSSRFISLSGLSGIAAGIWALAGAGIARNILHNYNNRISYESFRAKLDDVVSIQLLGLAAGVFIVAFLSSFYFTWRKSRQQNRSLWDHTSRRLFWNMVIPLVAGGLFILSMLQYNEWRFVAPACLIFYGLALVNASKYTLTDIRYLGYCEIMLGLLATQWTGYGLYFWAMGFGVLHIVYGSIMWWRYERV